MLQIDLRGLPDSLSFASLPKSLFHSFLNLLRRVFLLVLLHPTRAGCLNCSFVSPLWFHIDLCWYCFRFAARWAKLVFLLLRKARTEAELQRRSCSVAYPSLVALTHAALIGHGYRAHQPSEFHRMIEIGRGSCALANVPAKRPVELCDISRRPLKGF